MRIHLLGLLLCGLLSSVLHAQIADTDKIRYGKFTDEELSLETYEPDPDADAVVILDNGALRMEYDPDTRFMQMVIERQLRIKVLRESGAEQGDITFYLERSRTSSNKEEFSSIKGMTVNVIDGEAEETKLTKDHIFREKVTDEIEKVTLSFPQVRKGSIIELKYTYTSDFLFNLPTWFFQREIPVDYSHFEAVIPEYFYYNLDMKGFASDRLIENVANQRGSGSMVITGRDGGKLDFSTRIYRWSASQVPALREEAFSPVVSNYFFRVEFELATVNFPGQLGTNYTQDWDGVVRTYQRNYNEQRFLNPVNEVAALANEWAAGSDTPQATMANIYEGLQRQLNWDNRFTIFPSGGPNEILRQGGGNSADLNYILMSALRAKGIQAYPVLLSTRQNGFLSLSRPSLSQFNHLIVYAALDENNAMLLDATGLNIPAGLLPQYCLNDRGRILLDDESSQWINLTPPASDKLAQQLTLDLDSEGTLTGSLNFKASDYANLRVLREADSDLLAYLNDYTGCSVTDLTSSQFGNVYQPVSAAVSIDASEQVTVADDLLYVNAVLFSTFDENPFKAEERILPVDLQLPQESVYVTQINLPDNLNIEELPEGATFSLPEGAGRYSLAVREMAGGLQIIEKMSLKKPLFLMTEYAALRQFMELIIENRQAVLVFRKA